MKPALYGIVARRITVVDGEERAELIRCNSAVELVDLAPLLEEYTIAYGAADDVLVDLDATPTA